MARYIPCAPREPLSRSSFGPILVWIEPRRFCRGLNVEGVGEEQRVSCQEGAGSAVTASVSSSSRFLFLSPLGDSCGCPSVGVHVSSPLISGNQCDPFPTATCPPCRAGAGFHPLPNRWHREKFMGVRAPRHCPSSSASCQTSSTGRAEEGSLPAFGCCCRGSGRGVVTRPGTGSIPGRKRLDPVPATVAATLSPVGRLVCQGDWHHSAQPAPAGLAQSPVAL